MKATIKKYTPPSNGYILRLGFDEITTIKMALESKLKNNFRNRRSQFGKREIKFTTKAMRAVAQGEIYVD
jgi:hypothetical protein